MVVGFLLVGVVSACEAVAAAAADGMSIAAEAGSGESGDDTALVVSPLIAAAIASDFVSVAGVEGMTATAVGVKN